MKLGKLNLNSSQRTKIHTNYFLKMDKKKNNEWLFCQILKYVKD